LEADEQSVEILTQSILGNVDYNLPDSIDAAMLKFVTTILGIEEKNLEKKILKVYDETRDFRTYSDSSNSKMMTLVKN